MNLEEINKRNDEMEKELKIHQDIVGLDGKTNVEKLIFFNLISNQRIDEIKEIHFTNYDILEWEEKKTTLTEVEIQTNKIAGTWHPDYTDMPLYDALNNLKKFPGILSQYLVNPKYYNSNETRINHDKQLNLIYKESEDKYYIDGHANNRFITILAMGLKIVLVNTIEVYSENKQLKRIHQWMKNNNFNFETSSNKNIITVKSDFFNVELYNNSLENIEIFMTKYESLNVSNMKIRLYKIRAFLNYSYKNKFEYADDITHLFHERYLELREHKLQNS